MQHRVTAALAALALLNVMIPEPMVLDALGAGLSWLGFDLVFGGNSGF